MALYNLLQENKHNALARSQEDRDRLASTGATDLFIKQAMKTDMPITEIYTLCHFIFNPVMLEVWHVLKDQKDPDFFMYLFTSCIIVIDKTYDARLLRDEVISDMIDLEKHASAALKIINKYSENNRTRGYSAHGMEDVILQHKTFRYMESKGQNPVSIRRFLSLLLNNVRHYKAFRQKSIIHHADFSIMTRQRSVKKDTIRYLLGVLWQRGIDLKAPHILGKVIPALVTVILYVRDNQEHEISDDDVRKSYDDFVSRLEAISNNS